MDAQAFRSPLAKFALALWMGWLHRRLQLERTMAVMPCLSPIHWQSMLRTRGPFRLLGMPDLAKSKAALSHGSEWTAQQYVSTMERTPSTWVSGVGRLS